MFALTGTAPTFYFVPANVKLSDDGEEGEILEVMVTSVFKNGCDKNSCQKYSSKKVVNNSRQNSCQK